MKGFGLFRHISHTSREALADLIEWYKYASVSHQSVPSHRMRVAAGEFSQNFEVVGYNAKDEQEFELDWNRLAKVTQKQPGYKYTKLYKASYWDNSPIHYFKVRLWRSKKDMENYYKSQAFLQLNKKLETNATKVYRDHPKVVIDDSIRRKIPF